MKNSSSNIHTMLIEILPAQNLCLQQINFITGHAAINLIFLPYDDRLAEDDVLRLAEVFEDKLEFHKLGFVNTLHKSKGRPSYEPALIAKTLPLWLSQQDW